LKTIGADLKSAAKDAGKLKESEIRKLLFGLYTNIPYVIDVSFINSKGIMTIIEPDKYRKHEGSDISDQEAVILMQKSKRPFMSNLLDSVEGIKSIDIEYPVFYKDYPELVSLGKRMVREKDGTGYYTFLISGTDKIIKKQAAWKTIHFFDNDWIVVAYREIK